ncbi:MAG: hypothetical protein ACO1RX_07570 [Candidatus Sericytochromatia bacterium]
MRYIVPALLLAVSLAACAPSSPPTTSPQPSPSASPVPSATAAPPLIPALPPLNVALRAEAPFPENEQLYFGSAAWNPDHSQILIALRQVNREAQREETYYVLRNLATRQDTAAGMSSEYVPQRIWWEQPDHILVLEQTIPIERPARARLLEITPSTGQRRVVHDMPNQDDGAYSLVLHRGDLYTVENRQGELRLLRKNIASGESSTTALGSASLLGGNNHRLYLSPDHTTGMLHTSSTRDPQLYRIDLTTAALTRLNLTLSREGVHVAPDGQHVLINMGNLGPAHLYDLQGQLRHTFPMGLTASGWHWESPQQILQTYTGSGRGDTYEIKRWNLQGQLEQSWTLPLAEPPFDRFSEWAFNPQEQSLSAVSTSPPEAPQPDPRLDASAGITWLKPNGQIQRTRLALANVNRISHAGRPYDGEAGPSFFTTSARQGEGFRLVLYGPELATGEIKELARLEK